MHNLFAGLQWSEKSLGGDKNGEKERESAQKSVFGAERRYEFGTSEVARASRPS